MSFIALVRHGQTDYNKNKIIQGQIDIPLNNLGKEQAQKTAKHFKEESVDVIISSPLSRAQETASIIAKEINYEADISINEAFIERNFGEADGKDIPKYIDLVHEEKVNGLEPKQQLQKRMMNGILNVAKKYPEKNIMIVCHSHSIKAVLSYLEPDLYNFSTHLSNCSITFLNYNNNQLKLMKTNINDYVK